MQWLAQEHQKAWKSYVDDQRIISIVSISI